MTGRTQAFTALCLTMLWLISAGCAGTNNTAGEFGEHTDSDVRAQVEAQFGELTDDQIEAFERELNGQYDQLFVTYDRYDAVRKAPEGVAADDHDEHRLHRKLKRRHRTLARLHEDRMWLHLDGGEPSAEDRQLAQAHRGAARWHEERFREDGAGVEEQDAELELLRDQLEDADAFLRH